jgi:hypothetical protein
MGTEVVVKRVNVTPGWYDIVMTFNCTLSALQKLLLESNHQSFDRTYSLSLHAINYMAL